MSTTARGSTTSTSIKKEIPPVRPLKRSASLASLPTPPRTRRNPSRSQSRASVESDSESDSETDDKRRKLSNDQGDEDAFWLDKDKGKERERERTQTRSPSPDVDYVVSKRLTRSKSATSEASASLASPPPSRRHPPAPVKTTTLPVTPNRPTTRSQTKKKWTLLEDEEDNPFVDTPGKEEKEDELPVLDLNKVASPAEKPTVTYVFRGKRAQFANPHYVSPTETPLTKAKREDKYNLPLDHPDYSPDPRCPPKRLFFKKTTTTRTVKTESTKKATTKTTMLSRIESDDEEEEDLFGGDVKGVAKRLFVEGAGKGSVDAGMVKVDVLIKRGQPSATDDD